MRPHDEVFSIGPLPTPRNQTISLTNKSSYSSTKSSFATITYRPKSRKSSKVSRMGIEFDFYPAFTSRKPKSSWNLTKFNSLQQNHPDWFTPTAKNASTRGADAFGTPVTSQETLVSLTPENSPFPRSAQPLQQNPSTRKPLDVSSPTLTTSASTHCTGTVTDRPESTPQISQRISQTSPLPEPAPRNQSIVQLACYLHHLAFVESTFARAIAHDRALPQHPHISLSGTPKNSRAPDQDYIISVTQTLLNLASRSRSAPATSESGRTPLRRTRPFLHRTPRGNSSRGTTSPRAPPVPPPASPLLPPIPDYATPVYPSLATPAPVFIPPPPSPHASSPDLTGRSPQPFLPEQLYLAKTLPTRTRAELQSFLNHCNYLLQNYQEKVIRHSLTELHSITPNPVDFRGFLWRYKVVITRSGVFEDYREIVRNTADQVIAYKAYEVFYSWTDQSYTVTLI